MADAGNDVDQINGSLAAMAEKAAADPEYRESLKTNQVDALLNAGVSAFALCEVYEELGADSEEVAAHGMEMGGPLRMPPPDGSSEIIINTVCIGTCMKATWEITARRRGPKS